MPAGQNGRGRIHAPTILAALAVLGAAAIAAAPAVAILAAIANHLS